MTTLNGLALSLLYNKLRSRTNTKRVWCDVLKNPNRKSPVVHLNRLLPSSQDTVALGYAVETRFIEVVDQWLQPPPRGRGEPLVPPVELDRSLLLWREMRIRHKRRDYRNTDDELRATQRIADWVLRVKAVLVGQDAKTVDWQ